MVVQCHECEKGRLIYSNYASERRELQVILEDTLFSCGSSFEDIDCGESPVLKKVFYHLNLNCSSPIEIPYYSTNHETLCYYCGVDNDFASGELFSDKYPICLHCFLTTKSLLLQEKERNIQTDIYHVYSFLLCFV